MAQKDYLMKQVTELELSYFHRTRVVSEHLTEGIRR